MNSLLMAVVVVLVGSTSLSAAGPKDAASTLPVEHLEFFEKRIRPLLAEHCYSCHSSQAKRVRGGLWLDTRKGTLAGGDSGPAVVPSHPEKSLLLEAVRQNKDLRMPPKGKLSREQIADLEKWVRLGAPDPRTAPSTAKAPTGIDLEAGRSFWAFRPVRNSEPPQVKDRDWPLNPIDRFLLARLEKKGIRPAAPADPRTLVRRLTFDLTGLPPTPEEIDRFLKENAAAPEAAWNALIERLLASPAYAERYGRWWLDVVRYADTAGDNSDYPIPQMIRYRDWVIDAVAADMPYDRFVQEQLAGDLMPAASAEDRRKKILATGYLANSRRHGSYEDKRYPWHLTIEDTLDNLGKAFLGMTLGCARCHDHKFDPIGIDDYYALYGFFNGTSYPWPGIELDKVQRHLVPLASAKEIDAARKERDDRLRALDERIRKMERDKAAKKDLDKVRQERNRLAGAPLPFEYAYAVTDGSSRPERRIGKIGDVAVQLKGDPDRPGKVVPRRFLAVLGGHVLPKDVTDSGRLHLARWITDPGNPLTARVMVNRLWHWHFGRGLVATPNNFGKQGTPPTHPELLDWLAHRFVQEGWSLKKMHRLILQSRTYRLGSGSDATDPDNALFGRWEPRRLDAEAIRDSLLAVAGNLDRSRGGPHPFPEMKDWNFTQHRPFKAVYDTNRRSVYLMTQRIQRHPFLALFDGPDTNASTATRLTSTTPLQALFLMNDPFVHAQARTFADRLQRERSSDKDRIERVFLLTLGRPPAAEEARQVADYLSSVHRALEKTGVPADQRGPRAWESLARALFMSSEFVYVE